MSRLPRISNAKIIFPYFVKVEREDITDLERLKN